MKKQIIFIHGGETFEKYDDYLETLKSWDFDPQGDTSKRWSKQLAERLGDDFEIISPIMPCKYNAKYVEWKIWFEKVLEFVSENTVFVGHSLGGTFLLKYFSENYKKNKFKKLILISAAVQKETNGYSLSSFVLNLDLVKKIQEIFKEILIIHSQDDPVVPFKDFEILTGLLPKARKMIFQDRGHFLLEEFPELEKEFLKSKQDYH